MFISILNGFFELEIFTEAKSFLVIFLIIEIFLLGIKYNLIEVSKIIKVGIWSHSFYVFVKLVVFFLIYHGIVDISILKLISRDFVIAFFGNIPRITINNDLFSCIFLSILILNKSCFSQRWLNFVISILFILNILISFNRISIFCMLVFFVLYGVWFLKFKKIKVNFEIVFSLILVLSIINWAYLNNISLIEGIVNTISNRFGGEGELSLSEKIFQYRLILNNMSFSSFLIGHGIGTFLPQYIRYDIVGLRYGYEAFMGIILYQLGIIGLSYFLIMLNKPFFSSSLFKDKKNLMHFIIYNMWILHSLVNPVVLSLNSATIMGIIITSNFCRREYFENSHFRDKRNT